MKRLWVPIIRYFDEDLPVREPLVRPRGSRRDGPEPVEGGDYVYGPDVPKRGMKWKMDNRACPIDLIPGSADYGRPLVAYAPILVEDQFADKIETAVSESTVPERDRLAVRMMQEASYDWEKDADKFFDSIPNVAAAAVERRRMVKDIVLQGVARGLSAEKAEAVCKRLNLPLAKDA